MLPIILSILIPGLGQIYYGRYTKGIIMILMGITPLYPIAVIWSVIDVIGLKRKGISPNSAIVKKAMMWILITVFVVIPIGLVIMISTSLYFARWYTQKYANPKYTRTELKRIASGIDKYYREVGSFPQDLNTLIKGRPRRAGWVTDRWGRPYFYEIVDDGKDYKLISSGKDGNLWTDDDIVFNKSKK